MNFKLQQFPRFLFILIGIWLWMQLFSILNQSGVTWTFFSTLLSKKAPYKLTSQINEARKSQSETWVFGEPAQLNRWKYNFISANNSISYISQSGLCSNHLRDFLKASLNASVRDINIQIVPQVWSNIDEKNPSCAAPAKLGLILKNKPISLHLWPIEESKVMFGAFGDIFVTHLDPRPLGAKSLDLLSFRDSLDRLKEISELTNQLAKQSKVSWILPTTISKSWEIPIVKWINKELPQQPIINWEQFKQQFEPSQAT